MSSPESGVDFRAPAAGPAAYRYIATDVIAGRYRLVRPIGGGGMGVIWLARSLALDVDVAVKLIHARLAGPTGTSRMAREAHATALLGHPAVVRVFDFGCTEQGVPFIVMELVSGENLGATLRREECLSPVDAIQLLLPVLDGLRAAHSKHIVHRDIKPDNIFIACDSFGRKQPKLLDFGLAKLDHPVGAEPNELTAGGLAVGSVEYMAPEQALGIEVDCRADVWACAVVLYECIAGLPPWPGPDSRAVVRGIMNDPAIPLGGCAPGDEELWAIIERGLQKDPDERWGSVSELGRALARWLHERGVTEDICGSSLRVLWLNGSAPEVRANIGARAPSRTELELPGVQGKPPRSATFLRRVRGWLESCLAPSPSIVSSPKHAAPVARAVSSR